MRGYSLGALTRDLFKLVFPVGIYLDFDRVVDPNVLFPGTTWEQVLDARLNRPSTSNVVGTAAGQIGAVAGADSVVLTIANLAAHSHSMAHTHVMTHGHTGSTGSDGAYTTTLNFGGNYVDSGNNTGNQVPRWGSNKAIATAADHTHTVAINNFTGSTGGSSAANTGTAGSASAVNITNPCRYVARWKRIA